MNISRQEYPRPQFVRDSWENLNGTWEFEMDLADSGAARGMEKAETAFSKQINVPFCPESELSGIGNKDFMAAVWYRRIIRIPAEKLSGRVLLHFGAVDYECTVYVNGEKAGTHRGGYSSFCFDITEHVKAGENLLTVQARDDVRGARQPGGKQSDQYGSYGCMYTRTTGIWQTVWLEYTSRCYLENVHTIADAASGVLAFSAKICSEAADAALHTTVSYKGQAVAETTVPVHTGITDFSVTVENPQLWDVGQPNLYDLCYELTVNGETVDTVSAYCGFRTIELKNHAFYLNGRPVFQRLVLDQGFYPDGIYTAPSDEALKHDIELSMQLGFNGARLHEKVFEERFLYWADRLGYLVWGEQANWGLDITTPEGVMNFLPEWLEVLNRDFNHPAIIGWCPFNETWDREGRKQDDRVLELVYRATKAVDSTRPVIDTSGNFHVATDIYDIHDYEQDPGIFAERYGATTPEHIYDTYENRQHYAGQPFFVSEYGGTWWSNESTDGWGYGNGPATQEELADRYCGLTETLLGNEYTCAFCYTQLYDVEQEQNGMYTYERKPKFKPEIYARITATNQKPAAIEKKK